MLALVDIQVLHPDMVCEIYISLGLWCGAIIGMCTDI